MTENFVSRSSVNSRSSSSGSFHQMIEWSKSFRLGSRDCHESTKQSRNNSARKTSISNGTKSTSLSTAHRSSTTANGSHAGSPVTAKTRKRKQTIGLARTTLAIVLVSCAVGFGFTSYRLIKTAETRLARDRFDSIATKAASSVGWVLERKKKSTDALALMMGTANPDASEWPFVYMEGYQAISSSLQVVTQGSLSFCTIVRGYGNSSVGGQQNDFEDYYFDLWDQWGYPNVTGHSVFGKGMFGYGYDAVNNKLWDDYRYPILSNRSAHGIPNPDHIMVPFVQSNFGFHTSLMLDVMFEASRARVVHDIIRCSEERTDTSINCGSITDMLWQRTNAKDVQTGPAGISFSPIYPRDDNTTLTGFILHKQIWYELLEQAFEPDVSGIRVVIHTSTGKEHTYNIEEGKAKYVGNRTHTCVKHHTFTRTHYLPEEKEMIECTPDDEWVPFDDLEYLQDENNGNFRRLNLSITDGLFMDGSVEYFMDVYATEVFVEKVGRIMGGEAEASNERVPVPVRACLVSVAIMIFTSLLFVSYDYCVRKEFDSKEKLLEAKRRFVRFVSHEVRTPLNTVCMGLTLLQNDMAMSLSEEDGDHSPNGSNKGKSNKGEEKEDMVVVKRDMLEEWMYLSGQVFQNADAAVGVLSDLLNYDKIQMGTLSLELSLINMWSALEKTVEEFQVSAKENLVSLEMDFTPLMSSELWENENETDGKGVEELVTNRPPLKASDLPAKILNNCKVVGDKIRLIQVFRNLISNGLKFSSENTRMTIRVSVDSLPERKHIQENVSLHKDIVAEVTKVGSISVEVIDEGAGMTQEQVDTVFEDGTQFDRNKLQAGGGSGLGLNIARGIVLEHGGTLTCSSEGLGRGTTFTLCTALYLDNNPTLPNEMSPGHRRSKALPSEYMEHMSDEENGLEYEEFTIPHFRVLVVDDSVTNRKLCQRLLERNGHTTEGACNGEEAVAMVKEAMANGKFYDCILLDYEMPVMNGPDACQLMRKMGCSSYIAGVTGNVMSEDVDHFRDCGANWVLPKPFRLKALEDQWVEDGVTPFSHAEQSGEGMVRVESSHQLIEMGDHLAVTFDANVKIS
mmetsp:Transcript_7504/g.21866  ORF Transcript_7504/g.21866 Transcript_7504/m.21866 type:complete len:1077 (-) Transcript_7504:296-3526(-)